MLDAQENRPVVGRDVPSGEVVPTEGSHGARNISVFLAAMGGCAVWLGSHPVSARDAPNR